MDKLYSFHGEPRHLSTIPLKNSYLFKIVESIINFYFKKKFTSTILNKEILLVEWWITSLVYHKDLIISHKYETRVQH